MQAAFEKAGRSFIFGAQASGRGHPPAKRSRLDRYAPDRQRSHQNRWILTANDRPEVTGLGLGSGFDYSKEHEIDLQLVSLLFRMATLNSFMSSGVEIIQNHVLTGDMQILIRNKVVDNFPASYRQFFQDSFIQMLYKSMLMQLVWGVAGDGVRLDPGTGIVVPYLPDYGMYKISVVHQDGTQKYLCYELDVGKSRVGEDVWVFNKNINIYDTLNPKAKPFIDGSLNSRMMRLLRAITDLDHLLESVALADELAARPATIVSVEPMANRPVDAAASQMGVHFGDAPMRDLMNVSMNIPIESYPQSSHMERERERTIMDADALRADLQQADAQSMQDTAIRRSREAGARSAQTVYTALPHIKVDRLPLPQHPATHFKRADFYIGEIATAFSIPQELLLVANNMGGLSGAGASTASYEMQVHRFNSMIREWNHFFMRLLNATNKKVLFLNGYMASQLALKHVKLTQTQATYGDLRTAWIKKIIHGVQPSVRKVLSAPARASDEDQLEYLYAADDEGCLRLNFSPAPSAVGVDMLMKLHEEKTLSRQGYIKLLSAKLVIDEDNFEKDPPPDPEAVSRKRPQPEKAKPAAAPVKAPQVTAAARGSAAEAPRRSARLQQREKS